MRVRFVASDRVGGGHLRSIWPSEVLRESGVTSRAETWFPRPDEYDVLVVHRPLSMTTPQEIRKFQDHGVTVYVDEDDDLTRLHEVKNRIAEQHWNPQMRVAHEQSMSIADGIIVSTPALAETYVDRNQNIRLCRNYIPRRVQGIRNYGRAAHAATVRVSWAGITDTHVHDLEWLRPVAREMLRDAVFVTIGDASTPRTLGVNGLVQEIYPFQTNPMALYKLMARAEIGVVPLLPCGFNESKSWLKALEYMTVGIPVVVTDLPEQRELITHGENGFLARTPQEFAQYVQILVHDAALRGKMAAAAKGRAAQLAIEDHVGQWQEVCRALEVA